MADKSDRLKMVVLTLKKDKKAVYPKKSEKTLLALSSIKRKVE